MHEVVLNVGGDKYSGWTEIQIVRSVDAIANAFSLTVRDEQDATGRRWRIARGSAITLTVDGQTLITGYVDRVSLRRSASRRAVTVEGRDTTGDLADSTAISKTWEKTDILRIAKALCAPHGVIISAALSTGAPLTVFSTEPGETVAQALARLAAFRGMLVINDGRGGLVLTRATKTARVVDVISPTRQGIELDATWDDSTRYAEVICRAEVGAGLFGAAQKAIEARATDPGVTRKSRRLIVTIDGADQGSLTARTRAQWECNTRFARSTTLKYTLRGWTAADGQIWPINHLVRVEDPDADAEGDFLISESVLELTAKSGWRTRITLMPPEALDVLPLPAPSKAGGFAFKAAG